MCMIETTVLMVGTGCKSQAISDLPVRLIRLGTGAEAIRSLRHERVDALVSQWDLVDIPDGTLLRNVINASPSIPTIALIEPGNFDQEIKAAQWGVTAIIPDDIDDDYFRQVIAQLLGLEAMTLVSIANAHDT